MFHTDLLSRSRYCLFLLKIVDEVGTEKSPDMGLSHCLRTLNVMVGRYIYPSSALVHLDPVGEPALEL